MTIGKVVDDFKRVLPEADIYVYDNNSSDGTVSIAAIAVPSCATESRQGKGNVVRQMFAISTRTTTSWSMAMTPIPPSLRVSFLLPYGRFR
ncbi:MAG: hypothetical protein ACLT98_04625 [Eggerthellaceae bacterium]